MNTRKPLSADHKAKIGAARRRPVAPGNKWCPHCASEKPLSAFNGIKKPYAICRTCVPIVKREAVARRAGQPDLTIEARFWAKVEKTNGCWLWKGGVKHDVPHRAYGVISYMGKQHSAHRVAFWMRGLEIPEDKVVDHICRNPRCVRFDHLRLVTQAENCTTLASPTCPANINKRKTECIRGHLFTMENTMRSAKGFRQCRTCHRLRAAGVFRQAA